MTTEAVPSERAALPRAGPALLPRLPAATRRVDTTVDNLFEQRYRASRAVGDDTDLTAAEQAFARRHGAIVEVCVKRVNSHLCGAVRTSRGEVHLRYPAHLHGPHADVYKGLWDVQVLAEQSNALLATPWRRIVAGRLMQAAGILLQAVEVDAKTEAAARRRGAGAPRRPRRRDLTPAARSACAELPRIERQLVELARARVQLHYLGGMVVGLLVLVAVAAFVDSRDFAAPAERMTVAALFGSVGACISVLTRIHRGRFHVDHETPLVNVGVMGCFRPLIGAVLAVALCLGVLAGVVQPFPNSADTTLALPLVAFLSGFSERWASMLIARSEGSGTPAEQASAGPPPQPAPAAPAAPRPAAPTAK